MSLAVKSNPLDDVRYIRDECRHLLADMRKYGDPEGTAIFHDTFRLLAIPLLYSAWERCFTSCNAIALRVMREETRAAGLLDVAQQVLWLQRSPFSSSLIDRLRAIPNDTHEETDLTHRVKKGQFTILKEFLEELRTWQARPLDPKIDTEDLVMTFSNVNARVVRLNAEAVGIATTTDFKNLDLTRLDELLNRRNSIGHGAVIAPPQDKAFNELWNYVDTLIESYTRCFETWMVETWPAATTVASQ